MIPGSLHENRKNGFWTASALAACLSLLSWINLKVVKLFNDHLFHTPESPHGWWLYVLLRAGLSGWLVWMIWSMPRAASTSSPAQNHGPQPAKKESFFDPLMGLRAFACFLVVMGHYFLVVFPFTDGSVPASAAMLLRSCPWAGVWIFFTLSGYLMGKGFTSGRYALTSSGMRAFLRNRFLRIAPVYYGSILLISAFRYPALFAWRHGWMLLEMCLFDFRGDLPTGSVAALWSVSTEVQFYLLAPLFILLLIRLRARIGTYFIFTPFLLLCLGTGLRVFLSHHPTKMSTYGYTPLAGNLDLFLCGMCINLIPRWKLVRGAWIGPALTVSIALFYVAICFVSSNREQFGMQLWHFWARLPAPVSIFAALFIYLAQSQAKVRLSRSVASLALRGVQWIGTLTYCLYVVHSDVFLAAAELFPKVHGLQLSLLEFPTAMLEAVGVAAFIYYLIEKPFDRKKRLMESALLDAP